MCFVETGCFTAAFTNEMYVVVVMMTFGTMLPAECIFYCIIRGGNGMYDAFVNKSLKGSVYSYPVKFFTRFFFHVMMGEGIF